MALAVPIPFSKFVVLLGDGATPTEAFSAPCAFSNRALNRTKNLNEIVVPDCDDEDEPGWVDRDPISKSWGISGDGLLDQSSVEVWDAFFEQNDSKNVKVVVTGSTGSVLVTYTGKAHLMAWNETAARGEKVQFSVEMAGDGALTITPVPSP